MTTKVSSVTTIHRKPKDGEKGQDGKDGKDGNDGVSPAVYQIVPSVNTAIKKGNTYSPDTISLQVRKTEGGNVTYVDSSLFFVINQWSSNYPEVGQFILYMSDGKGGTGYGTLSFNVGEHVYNSQISIYLYLKTSSGTVSLDQITIPVVSDGQNGNDGNDGDPGDPVMPNLFGYDNKVDSSAGSAVHTKTGMACMINSPSTGNNFINIYAGGSNTDKFAIGKYALSCKMRFTAIDNVPSNFYCRLTMQEGSVLSGSELPRNSLGQSQSTVSCGVDYYIKLKYNLTKQPYFLYFQISGLYSSSKILVDVSDLKIEHAEDINGTCTPFAGLAEDTIPQMPNMLVDTKFKFTKYWDVLHGSSMANMLQGQQGWVFGGVKVEIGKSYYSSVVPTDWSDSSVHDYNTYHLWVRFSYGSYERVIYLTTKSGYAYRSDLQFLLGQSTYYYSSNITFDYVSYGSSGWKDCYADFLRQDITGKLKPNTWYTLSYWHKSSGSGQLSTYIYPDVGVNGGVTMIDDAATQSKADNNHSIASDDSPTAWKRHTITFKTASYFGSGYRHYIVFRSHDLYQHQICMPKLEECEKATDFCVNDEDLSGAFLRNRDEYDSSKTYEYNEEFRDFCFNQDGDNVYFYVLKKKGSYGYGSNALPEYGKNNDVWLSQPMTAMTATDILLTNQMYTKVLSAVNARIEQLVVRRLETMVTNGAFISIQDGLLDVYANGSSKPNIRFGVDESGYAVLKYYDMAGNLLYNLGPQGIMGLTSATMARYQSFTMAATGITSSSANVGSLLGYTPTTYYLWAEGMLKVGSVYNYHAYMTGTVTSDKCQTNHFANTGKVVTTQASNGIMPTSVISDGYYMVGQAIDTTVTDKFTRQVRYYEGGKIASSFNLYLLNKQNTTYVVDTNGTRVVNKTIDQYIELTQATLPRD